MQQQLPPDDGTGVTQPLTDGYGGTEAIKAGRSSGGGGNVTATQLPNQTFTPKLVETAVTKPAIIPAPDDATYIPTVNRLDIIGTNMKVVMVSSMDDVGFLEGGVNVGYGTSNILNYSPSTTFNGPKKYEVVKNGYNAKQNYVLTVDRKYTSTTDPITKQILSANDFLYSEVITVSTYELQSDGSYSLVNTNALDGVSGPITLNFDLVQIPVPVVPVVPSVTPNPPVLIPVINYTTEEETIVEYEVIFSSNLRTELANNVILSYTLFSNSGNIVVANTISLGQSNDIRKLPLKNFVGGRVDFKVEYVNKPSNYTLTNIYQTYNTNKLVGLTNPDFSTWNSQPSSFSVSAEQLKSGIIVVANFSKETAHASPTIQINNSQLSVTVKDSDSDKNIAIPFTVQNTTSVDVYISGYGLVKTIQIASLSAIALATTGVVQLSFVNDFQRIYGTKKVTLVSQSAKYGTGESVEALVTFSSINDFPSMTEISYPTAIDIPSFSDYNIDYKIQYTSFAVTSVDVDLLAIDKSRLPIYRGLSANGDITINLKKLRETFPKWNGSDVVTLIFTPINKAGESVLTGNEYEIITKLGIPKIVIDENIFSTSIYKIFEAALAPIEPPKESKYLTHLANFGNDSQILISTWEDDNWTLSKKSEDALGNVYVKQEDEVQSVLLKLYSPIPPTVSENSTFWVTKLMANPLVETVVLTEQASLKCPPLKGPNFDIEIDYVKGLSTNFESLDNLILSSSTSSTQLVNKYLSSSVINTEDLNIEYTDGTHYLWNNFTHFSSAKERINNFVYKVQLIEVYDTLISATYTTSSLSETQERDRQTTKKYQLTNGFDGFENFLYESSSLGWPYNGNTIINSSDPIVTNWYNNIIELATIYDDNNANFILNNIPNYIVENENNDSLLLFFSMVGQHFDTIYYYTKAIERSRGLGYKHTGGISDKLLFDTLKSFNWDAKNLAADEQLWKYVFGVDSEGTTKETNPAKARTNEVWRRIVNNIPYLLKHKGTRQGIYALMACYGIPASNLSILEFGGPEVTDQTKSKLVMDNITTAVSMTSGSSLFIDWIETNIGRKPDTIELFVKPNEFRNSKLIVGDGWDVSIKTSSIDVDYGDIVFNISSSVSHAVTVPNIPIFNGRFFGLEVSRTQTGATDTFNVNIRQANKERTVFEATGSLVLSGSNWESGSQIQIGDKYVGSIDEFRLWETPLDVARFYEHVSFPEMINGNSISASTEDLFLRLDFEYPKNLHDVIYIPNVDTNIYFSSSVTRNDYEDNHLVGPLYSVKNTFIPFVTASGFTNTLVYPYNFEPIDRTIVLEIPDLGSSRYSTNKIRFEEQTLVANLSPKTRSTVKAFDQAPVDSNRVGLFFSPTKELNFDIAKSFGGINLDNYIGDPSDEYKDKYNELDGLRHYYFQRFDNRDIYAYINLIKLYEKSMFEDIKQMLPARVKATTGLLIEPHILERSKYHHHKPTGEYNAYESVIKYGDNLLSGESNQYEAEINTETVYTLLGENEQFDTLLTIEDDFRMIGENYQLDGVIHQGEDRTIIGESYQETASIDCHLGDPTITAEVEQGMELVGQSTYETLGFGIYAQSGSAIRTYYDRGGTLVKERVRVQIIRETKTKEYTYLTGSVGNRLYTVVGSLPYVETSINIQPFSGSTPPVSTDTMIVTPLHGYAKTHFRYTSDLTRGLENSFWRGSKNTAATTLDGTPPVETFLTNPNTLKVNKAGRDQSEPILEVE